MMLHGLMIQRNLHLSYVNWASTISAVPAGTQSPKTHLLNW